MNINRNIIYISLISFISICYGDLLFPENGMVLNYTHILYHWDQEPDAASYNLQVQDQFFDVILDIENLTTTHIGDSTFAWSSTYYWRNNFGAF